MRYFYSFLIIIVFISLSMVLTKIFNSKNTKSLGNNIGYIHEIKYIDNFLYAVTNTTPSKLIKINPKTLLVEKIISFPLNDKHILAWDFTYVKNKNKVYVVFGNKNTSVSEVALNNMSYKDIFYFETKKRVIGNAPSITSDNKFLYVLSTNSTSSINKISLNNLGLVSTFNLGNKLGLGHSIRHNDGFLYVTGQKNHGWIARINPNDFSYIYKSLDNKIKWPTDDMGITDKDIYVGSENNSGKIYKISKKDLSITVLTTQIKALCYGVYFDGHFIWALFKTRPGTLVKINPDNLSITKILLNKGENYPNEITSDLKNIYLSYWLPFEKITRIRK